MKKILICALLLIVSICCLCGCKSYYTILEFTYTNSDTTSEKSIYFNEDYESLTLNAKIEVENGIANMQIMDKQNNVAIWEKSTDKAEEFVIELSNIKANTEYIFSIEIKQTKYLHLLITSTEKLIKNKEKPEIA